jgi:hypothetical protein
MKRYQHVETNMYGVVLLGWRSSFKKARDLETNEYVVLKVCALCSCALFSVYANMMIFSINFYREL